MLTAAVPLDMAVLLRNYSIELNPRQPRIIDAAPGRLNPGTEVFLTWISGDDPMDLVAPASSLRRAGLFPVPHISARHLQSASQLERLAVRLVAEAGVDQVLVIGGDRDRPAGPFDSSLAVMESGLLQKAGILRMAIGGFPEGNPNIPDAVLEEALAAKVNFACATGLQLSIVTQFCFEAEPVVAWLRRVRGLGINIPIRIGLAGPAGLATLMRYAVQCGVGNSLRVLTKKPSFAKLLVEKGPEPILRGIVSALPYLPPAALPFGIACFHFFVFGGFNKTVDWIDNHRARPGQAPP